MTVKQKWILASIVLWLSVIWILSAQPGEISADSSSRFKQCLIGLFAWAPQLQLWLTQFLQYVPIRKIAHFMEYAVLGILTYFYFNEDEHRLLGTYAGRWALLLCMSVAAVDELHQLYVPGRDGKTADILLDTVGALVGILLSNQLRKILPLRRKQ